MSPFSWKLFFLIYSNTYVYKNVLLGPIGIRNNRNFRLHYIEDLQELLVWKYWLSENLFLADFLTTTTNIYYESKAHTHHRCLQEFSLLNFYSLLHGHSLSLYSCMLTYSLFQMKGRHTWCHSFYQSNQHYMLNQSNVWWNE